eukprot:s2780_g10.t1
MLKTNALLILQLFATQARNRLTVRASLNFNAALCHPYTSRLRAFGRIKMVAKMKDDLVGDDGAGCEFRVYDVHPNATSVFSHPTTSYKAESNRHVLSSKSHDSERFPILARQPRPEEPTDAEKELRRKRDEEQEQYMNSVVKIQTWGRVMLAKRKMAMAREQAIVQKGPQPLRGMLRLRMERVRPGGAKELVLSQTTPHKRHRAAIKIQVCKYGSKSMPAARYSRPCSMMHGEILGEGDSRVGLASTATSTIEDVWQPLLCGALQDFLQ